MVTIKKLIYDPGWWVTAVFVGLFVSILGGFLKHAVANTLAKFSTTFREWRRRKREVFLQEAADLACDFGLILDIHLRSIGMLVVWSLTVTMMVGFYILLQLLKDKPSLTLLPLVLMIFVTGILSFISYFRAFRWVGLSVAAKQI